MMNEVIASLPEFVAQTEKLSGRVPVCDAVSARDPSSNAANCADDNAIRPGVVADGHTNWPPTPSRSV
jgi:hypothetical protein